MNHTSRQLSVDRMIDEITAGRSGARMAPESTVAAPTPDETLVAELAGLDVIDWPADEVGERIACGVTREISTPRPEAPAGRHQSWWRLLLPAGALTAAAVVLLAVLLPGSSRPAKPSLTKPLRTAWQEARPLPDTAAGRGGPAGTWRLVSYLVPLGWQHNTAGIEGGYLTCPTAMTCYVQGDNATSVGARPVFNMLYVSTDGGVSWDVLPVPAGVTFTSSLSCASAVNCAAGALFNGQPVLAVTANGAHSWTLDPLPAGPSQIFQLSCPTTRTCVGLAAASAIILPGTSTGPVMGLSYPPYIGTRFLITTDGGAHFTTSASAPGESMINLSCPTARDCVAIGARDRDRGGRYGFEPGVVAITHDGGATWSSGTLPQSPGFFPRLTCIDTRHCYTLGWFGPFLQTSDLLASADFGRTWAVQRLPASVPDPQLDVLACASDSTCYASGDEEVPHKVDGRVISYSPVVVITQDGGVTWSRVAFAAPSVPPAGIPPGDSAESYPYIGAIQCPSLGSCIALGFTAQGSKSTPVYSTRGTP